MKAKIIQNEEDKLQRCKHDLVRKSPKSESQTQPSQSQTEEERIKSKEKVKKKKEDAKLRHEKILKNNEIKRLEVEEDIYLALMETTRRNEEFKISLCKTFEEKLRKSQEKHMTNLKERNNEYENAKKEREERFFQKYSQTFWDKKEKANAKKRKKQNHLKHLELIKEIREKKEQERREKQKEYQRKLDDMSNKRELLELQKEKKIENDIEVHKKKFLKTRENLKVLSEENEKGREHILEYQRAVIFTGVDKDIATSMKRVNAQESTVLSQMETQRKLLQFYRELNKIKDESIMKKSFEKKEKVYLNLKEAEKAKKKKE